MAQTRGRQLSFRDLLVSRGLEATVRAANPWWQGERLVDLPPVRRWAFGPVLEGLTKGLTKAVVLRGPRQVGKTTLLNQVIDKLLDDGVDPTRILRVQFDDLPDLRRLSMPIVDMCEWYAESILGMSFHKAARTGQRAFVFLDEVQNLPDWAPQLKNLVDLNPVRALVTGSSALRIEAGRDSLAGRITSIEMGPLLLREVAEIRSFGHLAAFLPENGLSPLRNRSFWVDLRAYGEQHRALRRQAFEAFSARGTYPVAQARADLPWERVADFLN